MFKLHSGCKNKNGRWKRNRKRIKKCRIKEKAINIYTLNSLFVATRYVHVQIQK